MRKAVAALLVALLALSACDPAPKDEKPSAPQLLTYGVADAPRQFDPQRVTTRAEQVLASALYWGLLTLDGAGALTPGLAESWNVSEDGLTYTFRLRDASWSDGRAVTAKDFVAAFQRMFAPRSANPLAPLLMAIRNAESVVARRSPATSLGVRALTEDVFEIELSRPEPALLGLLAEPGAAAVPSHALKGAWTTPGKMIVNGPYTVQRVQADGSIELVRNASFFAADTAGYDRIVVVPVDDDSKASALFAERALDIVDDAVRFTDVAALRQRDEQSVRIERAWGMHQLVLNTRAGPFKAAGVRRALATSIDRAALIDTVFPNLGPLPAYGVAPAGLAGYGEGARPAWADWPADQRQVETTRMLTEAGYGPEAPLTIDLLVLNRANDLALAEALAAQWRPLGIVVTAQAASPADYAKALASGNFTAALRRTAFSVSMPDAFLLDGLCVRGRKPLSGACNPEADRLYLAATKQADAAARAQGLRDAERLLVDDAALIGLVSVVRVALVDSSVAGWQESPGGRHMLSALKSAETK
jgi:oligopeptide transport system substrate-binding protein